MIDQPIPLSEIPPRTRVQIISFKSDRDIAQDLSHIKGDLDHVHSDLEHIEKDLDRQMNLEDMRAHIKGLDSEVHDLLEHTAHVENEHVNRLINMGLAIGSVVEVLTKIKQGPVLLATKESRITVDFDTARRIMVLWLPERQCGRRRRRGWLSGVRDRLSGVS